MTAKLPIKPGTLQVRVAAQREVLISKIEQSPSGSTRDVLIRRLNKLDLASKRLSAGTGSSLD